MKKKLVFFLFSCLLISTGLVSQTLINSAKVSKVSPRDFNDPIWAKAVEVKVSIMPQNLFNPTLTKASVSDLKARSVNDGKTLAFMLTWIDSTLDEVVDVNKFCDQAAVQFPYDTAKSPSFMMGNQAGRVQIIHWKSAWQRDIEKGFRTVKEAYPNYWTDVYTMSENKTENQGAAARDFDPSKDSDSNILNFMHGAYAGNPMSIFNRKDPSEENVAEGYGTLTTQKEQNSTAWGKWENNKWTLIISRPIQSADAQDCKIPSKGKVAFALWNGNKENVGAKKHYSMWVDLVLQKN